MVILNGLFTLPLSERSLQLAVVIQYSIVYTNSVYSTVVLNEMTRTLVVCLSCHTTVWCGTPAVYYTVLNSVEYGIRNTVYSVLITQHCISYY